MSQQKEFALARKENRQPICIFCGNALNTIYLQGSGMAYIGWDWNPKTRKYELCDDWGDFEWGELQCSKCNDGDFRKSFAQRNTAGFISNYTVRISIQEAMEMKILL